MTETADVRQDNQAARLALIVVAGACVALALGIYGKVHSPSGRTLTTLGFSGVIQMKAWLTTIAAAFLVVQLATALWMWGKLPGTGSAPASVAVVHRWSGTIAFVITVPVAFSCIWSLGFATYSTRVAVHSIAGCLFYGAYAAKMIGLRIKGLPGWTLPVLGGAVLSLLVVIWLTTSLWFFTSSGLPVT